MDNVNKVINGILLVMLSFGFLGLAPTVPSVGWLGFPLFLVGMILLIKRALGETE